MFTLFSSGLLFRFQAHDAVQCIQHHAAGRGHNLVWQLLDPKRGGYPPLLHSACIGINVQQFFRAKCFQ